MGAPIWQWKRRRSISGCVKFENKTTLGTFENYIIFVKLKIMHQFVTLFAIFDIGISQIYEYDIIVFPDIRIGTPKWFIP
jgi:hypothetical protein